ncbi:MAG: hypothetical protein IJ272_10300 [Clostridia bacterium]|nr:hypothetical protein [Clostridia bacterium]
MAKDNEFIETLQNSVEGDVLRDTEVQKLEQELIELEGLTIKTPEQAKRIKEIKEKLGKIVGKEKNVEGKAEKKDISPERFNIKTANYNQLLARRAEVKLALEEALASPVKDNKKIDELRKELDELDKAIIAMENLEKVDEKEDKKTEQQENAEVEEQQKDEQDLSENEKQEQAAKEAELKQAYYDAMVNFYAIREANANKLKNTPDRLVNTDEEYLQEIKAEDAMYRAREEYLKLGKSDPYTTEREALNEQAKRCEKENRDILTQKTGEYRKLEIELAKLQKARAEKEEDIAKAIQGGATQEIIAELNDDLKELDLKIKNTKQDLAKVKDNLSQAMETLELRRDRRRELNLESREYTAQSAKEQSNLRASSNKAAQSRNDFVQAGKLSTSSIKEEVKRNEKRYNDIKKQLEELKEKEPDNFEKRLALLEQLDDASQQLKASREVQKDVERGIEPDTDEAVKQAEKDYKSKEERKEDFAKDAEKLREAAEAQEKAEGERTIEDPTGISEEVAKQQKDAATMAVVGSMAIGGPEGDALAAGTIVEATEHEQEAVPPKGAPCPIAELNDPKLYVQMDEEGSKEYVQTVEAIEAANRVEEQAIEEAEKS